MTLKELTDQLLSLTPAEKAEAIQILTHSLDRNWRGIAKTPGVCGGDACIAGTRIPVWVLVDYRRLGTSDSELLNNSMQFREARDFIQYKLIENLLLNFFWDSL